MKRLMLLLALAGVLNGCAWFNHGEEGAAVGVSTPDSPPVRGTTGVSSGADAGLGVTGSDLAPPVR
jgi:hypothetical protein